MTKCFVCETELDELREGDLFYCNCPRCGVFQLTIEAKEDMGSFLRAKKDAAQILSYSIRHMATKDRNPVITSDLILAILDQVSLPRPHEQLDQLILWLGSKQQSSGDEVEVTDEVDAVVGARSKMDVGFVIDYGISSGLLIGKVVRSIGGLPAFLPIQLTFDGWSYLDSLRKQSSRVNRAFMAMPFNDEQLDNFFNNYLRDAVKKAGFDLQRLDDLQMAGLIDDHLRVQIRQSKLLIADLTGNNNGAYWEAGYAEGLGIPVIYTCNKEFFEKNKTHFDTNHHLTIIWDFENIADAMRKLKDTIRATLPNDAMFED